MSDQQAIEQSHDLGLEVKEKLYSRFLVVLEDLGDCELQAELIRIPYSFRR